MIIVKFVIALIMVSSLLIMVGEFGFTFAKGISHFIKK